MPSPHLGHPVDESEASDSDSPSAGVGGKRLVGAMATVVDAAKAEATDGGMWSVEGLEH